MFGKKFRKETIAMEVLVVNKHVAFVFINNFMYEYGSLKKLGIGDYCTMPFLWSFFIHKIFSKTRKFFVYQFVKSYTDVCHLKLPNLNK